MGYTDFDVAFSAQTPEAVAPKAAEEDVSDREVAQEPEREAIQDWLVITLCLFLILVIFSYIPLVISGWLD